MFQKAAVSTITAAGQRQLPVSFTCQSGPECYRKKITITDYW